MAWMIQTQSFSAYNTMSLCPLTTEAEASMTEEKKTAQLGQTSSDMSSSFHDSLRALSRFWIQNMRKREGEGEGGEEEKSGGLKSEILVREKKQRHRFFPSKCYTI